MCVEKLTPGKTTKGKENTYLGPINDSQLAKMKKSIPDMSLP